MQYAVFTHQSDELGHGEMLKYLQAEPLLSLGMRLGEGTGAGNRVSASAVSSRVSK
jgi:nicotinate-nucleotide--dimethylbenzimidazole phosphoribosyltransferase